MVGEEIMKFIVDERERASGLIDALEKEKDLEFEVKMLEIGDVFIPPDLPIEIKRITSTSNDLFESLKDRRLYLQSQQRRDKYGFSIMIFEIEDMNNLTNAHFSPKAFENLEFSLEIDFNTAIYHTYSQKETIELIKKIWAKKKKGKRIVEEINNSKIPLSHKQKQLRLLTGLLDCAEVRAKELLGFYRTPMSVFKNICREHPLYLPGIGKSFFEKNKKLLTEE